MKKRYYNAVFLALLLVLLLIASGAQGALGPAPVVAQTVTDPQDALAQAWARARQTGSYRFLATADQTMIPRPLPEMIGQRDVRLTLENKGAVVLPDRSYVEVRVAGLGKDNSAAMLRNGTQAFLVQDGMVKPTDNAFSLATPNNDLLGYLAAAEQVTRLDPPDGHPELARYGFRVSGPRFAEYVRNLAEAELRAQPGAPEGLTAKASPTLRQITGRGEVWVNQAGLPVREIMDLQMPEISESYGAKVHMVVDLSGYGKVVSLPKAIQGADGTWRLEGESTLPSDATTNPTAKDAGNTTTLVAAAIEPAAAIPEVTASRSATWRTPLSGLFPLRVDPTMVALFVLLAVGILVVRLYRRDPQLCYTLIVAIVLPSMSLSPLLHAGQVIVFMERQAQAAETRAGTVSDLPRALGLQTQTTPAFSTAQTGAGKVTAKAGEPATGKAGATTRSAPAAPNLPPSTAPKQAVEGHGIAQAQAGLRSAAALRCGDGEPGVDSDGDGLTNQVEMCLGTNPYSVDSDGDAITDTLELRGFDYGGKHWDSDPLKPDSNGDGLLDTIEWSRDLAPGKGQAVSIDLDNDAIPDLWDDDNDNDGVPDAQDISPLAVTDYATSVDLSTEGGDFHGYQFIQIQVQPGDRSHLRYSTTSLDWPRDSKGNIRDTDESTDDLRLIPYLLVTTNVEPPASLAEKYGVRCWRSGDDYVLLISATPVQQGGAIFAFGGQVPYAPGQTASIRWQVKLVWMVQMQDDRWQQSPPMTITTSRLLHQYEDSFRITGLTVSKDTGYEAAVLGTPAQADDLDLFKVFMGLASTFMSSLRMEGQEPGETALQEIAQRFAVGSTANITHTFGVSRTEVAMSAPTLYAHTDAAVSGVGSDLVPSFLEQYHLYYEGGRCRDAAGNLVNCATLLTAYESSRGSLGLGSLPRTISGTTDLSLLHVNLADIPLLATRGLQMHLYEERSGGWQVTTAARMLELIGQRYAGVSNTGLRSLYPDLTAEDLRYLAYCSYLWATNPTYRVVAADGQTLVPDLADESQAALGRSLPAEMQDAATTAVDWFALGSGMADATAVGAGMVWVVGDWVKWGQDFKEKGLVFNTGFDLMCAGLFLLSTVASTAMSIINAICAGAPDLGMCQNEDALFWANYAVDTLAVIYQEAWLAQTLLGVIENTLDAFVSIPARVSICIGWVISVGAIWGNFAYVAASTVGDPVTWRLALAEAIVNTIWQTVLLLLNLIPFAGQIIVIILQLIDMIISLFTGLFGEGTSIAQIILSWFYDVQTLTSLQSAGYGTFQSGLKDPDMGMVEGNEMRLSLPINGVMQKDELGSMDDLTRLSWVKGDLTWQWSQWSTEEQAALFDAQSKTTRPVGVVINDTMAFSNTAAVGYALTARVNGLVPFLARITYQYVWAEFGGNDAWRWETHVDQNTIPEYADMLEPNKMYLDVLPASLTELWNWSALTNPDRDGDGLTNEQEAALGTNPDVWDTDGDGLSDWYEWQTFATHGCSPLVADSDGDGLNDGLELRLGTRPDMADSDGDGLKDGAELRHLQSGQLAGGWQVTLSGAGTVRVSSDPVQPDTDHDGLNDPEEKANGLSPNAPNALVPTLSLSATPLRSFGSGRAGAYWVSGEDVQIKVQMSNGSEQPVSATLTLDLPPWLTNIQGGVMQGDHTPALSMNGHSLSWPFTGANNLLTGESVRTTITATASGSGSGEIVLQVPYDDVQMRKSIPAIIDGDDPNVAIMAPAKGAYLRGTSYVVGGSATDPTTWITARSLSIVPQGQAVNFQALPVGQGAWAYSWSLPTTDGVYSLQARATDAMQHQKTTGTVTVTVDNTAPAVGIGSQMVNGKVRLSGAATDNLSGVEWVQLGIDAQPWRIASLTGAGTTNAVWSYDWTVGDSAQGQHVVLVRAVDRCGNASAIVSQTITVDRVAPSSEVTGGASKDIPPAVKAGSTFTLTGVADEGGHLPLPAVPIDLRPGMDVFGDAPLWLGLSSIRDNDGGVLAAWVGDFNADRLADLAVCLPGPSGDAGQVAILYGRAGGWPTPPDLEMLADSPTRFLGAPGVQLGSYVAAAGDVNGDSMADLLIGERSSTRAFLVFGNPGPLGEMTLDGGLAAYRTMLQAPAAVEGMASAGDVNGDGYDDLLIRAGGTAYLLLGQTDLWPETVDVVASAKATFNSVKGALGVGDVNNDQRAEWVTTAANKVTLYKWDATLSPAAARAISTWTVNDTAPRAVALGDVDGDGVPDWLYSNGSSGTSRILVYGSGPTTYAFSGYDGFFAAPGDVDGDGRADILLSNTGGTAYLIRQQAGAGPATFATISGVGGAANAPYAAGADLNADGSSELLLIPSQAAAEGRGFDAPDFSTGFVSPQALPQGASSPTGAVGATPKQGVRILSVGPDTRYVDDDAVGNTCDGHSPCYATIQAAVDATDGGGDTIIVYPGVYKYFRVPADRKYDNLTIQGVSPDAVFVESNPGAGQLDAMHIAADGVRIANLTVRNAAGGVVLEDGAGAPPVGGGSETFVERVAIHSTQHPISMSQGVALTLVDSTLAANASSNEILYVNPGASSVHTWNNDQTTSLPITGGGTLASAAGNLYALAGGASAAIYQATPGANGALGAWSQPFDLKHAPPRDTGTLTGDQGKSLLAASGDALYQLHSSYREPFWGGRFNGQVRAVAVHPATGDVYVGGDFTWIGSVAALHIARWDGTSWHPLGATLQDNGTNGAVYALDFVPTDCNGTSYQLYAGGVFTMAGQSRVGYVVRWDGANWQPLGLEGQTASGQAKNGVNGPVYALAHDRCGYLWVGGSFSYAQDLSVPCGETYENLGLWTPAAPNGGCRWSAAVAQAGTNGTIRAMAFVGDAWHSSPLYVAGEFTTAGGVAASGTASRLGGNTPAWAPLGSGRTNVNDLAVEPSGHLVAACGPSSDANAGVWHWDGSTWTKPAGQTSSGAPMAANAVAVDAEGNVYGAGQDGLIFVQYGGVGDFYRVGAENPVGSSTTLMDLALDSSGRLWTGSHAYDYGSRTYYGAVSRWTPGGLFKHPVPNGNWSQKEYLRRANWWEAPDALVGDGSGNLYAMWYDGTSHLHYYDATANRWTEKAPGPAGAGLKHLAWADGKLYALGWYWDGRSYDWRLFRYDPAVSSWSQMATAWFIAPGTDHAQGLSWSWDGGDYIYVLAGDGTRSFLRYRLSTDAWEALPDPSVGFSVSYGPALARVGSYLYAYATPVSGGTTNLFRYGTLPPSDLRLAVERTAFVAPVAAQTRYTNLNPATGSAIFQTDIDTTNRWVGPSGTTWTPALPPGAATLATTQAAFVAPEDGLYRVGAGSQLHVGYHQYKGTAHVYPWPAACDACATGDLTWGETAFGTVRAAIESGAARVLVHPGRYPQTFYLVSGVEVMGSGAETTIIEPPVGATGTLVTAEGVAHSSLSRVTLAGKPGWQGLLAEGGVQGLKLVRNIVRDLTTGLRLRQGSEVEVVNNTLVRNTNGLVAEGTNPVNVRNSIFAYNTAMGLQRGTETTSLSNIYNDFYGNGTDINPVDVGGGKLYRNPRFRDLAGNDLRLAAASPMIDMGAPNDPTLPGTGTRTDIGYAEYNAAGFYASTSYSETGLNDGLTWGVDAFNTIQAALDAAAATLRGLQGALPEGGYSVGVHAGTYTETVTVPSHVRLVGSGADVSTISANHSGSAVTFDGVIDAEVSGFTLKGASSGGAGVEVKGASNGITIERNLIAGNAGQGVSLAGGSSGTVRFSTIADNNGTGVLVDGSGAWATVRNNIIAGQEAYGLRATPSGLLRQDYNLFYDNTSGDLSGVAAGDHTLTGDPAFAATNYYLTAASPAIDAADPLEAVPLAGGVRADLGYKELIASPLTLLFGPQNASTVTANSGVAKVEVGVALVTDASQPVTVTLPMTWTTVTGNNQGLFYWQHNLSLGTPGLYRAYTRATDAKGNAETVQTDWYEGAFVVDSTAPTVTWGAPALPSSTSAAAALATALVTGTVSAGTGTRSDVKQVYFSVTAPAGTFNYIGEWDGSAYRAWIPFPTTGSYTINAVATDEAGNLGQTASSKTVVVGGGSHVATVESSAAGSAVPSTTVALRGDVRFTATGAGAVVATTGSTTVTATLETPGALFSAWWAEITLAAGGGAKTITVTPSLGGVPGTATTLNLALDTTAPIVTVTTPVANTTVTQTMTFVGIATDSGSGLALVEVSVDGGYTWRQATLNSGAWSLSWDLGSGGDYVSYPAHVRAVDRAGNVVAVERVVTVDSVPSTGLAPVSFSEPVGQHLIKGTSLAISWHAPTDASGTTQVYLAVDQNAETVPSDAVSGTSSSATLKAVGDWYVHLMAQDATGNQSLYHYGPWHVRDMTNPTFSARRQSIIVDGFIDLTHNEWVAGDLLGTDARRLQAQQLYATWDGQAIYLGWSGAWWKLDGSMWAYLDVTAGGSNRSVGGGHRLPFDADLAVLIDSPEDGSLYTWDGSSWVLSMDPLDFGHGSTGDTETRIVQALTADQTVQLVAFALSRDASEGTASLAGGRALAATVAEEGQPWAVFPNTNPLGSGATGAYTATVAYNWSTPVVDAPNEGQPSARTVRFAVTSPQPTAQAWCPNSTLEYGIVLENPDPTTISGLTLVLTATTGLGYQSVTGATRASGTVGGRNWTLNVPELAAMASTHVTVTAQTGAAADLSGLATVTSTVQLAAASGPLTGETVATTSHRVDSQAPTVIIDVRPGAAIRAGTYTFTGLASDGDGSGLARVEVRQQGTATWTQAVGALSWSAALAIPAGATQFTLEARAVDACGQTSTATQTFSVDTTAPQLSWTVAEAVTGTVAVLSGSTADPAPAGALVRSVQVQLDKATSAWYMTNGPFAPSNSAQAWSWIWTLPYEDGVTHLLRARAQDAMGNTTDTAWQTTVVDTVAPRITVTVYVDTTWIADSQINLGQNSSAVALARRAAADGAGTATRVAAQVGTLLLGGLVTDGAGMRSVSVWVYDSLGKVTQVSVPLVGGAWAFSPDLTGWATGDYALRVVAEDVHGNTRVQGPYALHLQERPVGNVSATNDGPRMVGETVTFTATVSAGSNVSYAWAFGDGATGTGRVTQHSYAASGSYTAQVTASNSLSTTQATTVVTILAMGVEAGKDQTANEVSPVNVVASFTDSRATELHTATIGWGDGGQSVGTVDEVANTLSGTHAFADNGAYTVTVTLRDEAGHAVADTLRVLVNNVAPTIALGGAASVNEGSTYTLTLGAITDPGTDTVDLRVVHWGDGASSSYTGGGDVTHVYTDGLTTPTITVNLRDEDGTYVGAGSKSIAVKDVAPTIALSGAASVNEGSTYTLTLGSITDAGADRVTTWKVNWGDGASSSYATAGYATHFYADGPSSPTITVDLTDEDGLHADAGSKSITVNDVAPTIALSGPTSLDEGSTYTLTLGAITDLGADTVAQWIVNWGDGASNAYTAGGNVTHVYPDGPSSPTITVDLKDEDGLYVGAGSKTITVNNVAPTIVLSGPASVNEGSFYTLTLGQITDPGRDTVSQWILNWGDGTSSIYTTPGNVTHKYVDGPSSPTISVALRDEDGLYVGVASKSITVNNVAPTIALSGAASLNEGGTYALTLGAITDPGVDTVITWTVHWGDNSTSLYASAGVKNHIYVDGPASPKITVDLRDEDGTFVNVGSRTITVNNVPPVVVASPISQTLQYSDPIATLTFTGTDIAADWMTASLSYRSVDGSTTGSGASAGLTLGARSCGTTGSQNVCTWKVTGNISLPAGTYTVTLTVTDKDSAATARGVAVTVRAEDAVVAFDTANPVAVPVPTAGGTSGIIMLRVAVGERPDGAPGNISLAGVSMSLSPVGSGGAVVGTVISTTVQGGQKHVTFRFSGLAVNTYVAQVAVAGGYYAGYDEDVLVVYDRSLGFTSGGGWFYWPGTAKLGYAGDKTNFGYTMKYNKGGSNMQGNLVLIRHLPDGTEYRIKSNALAGLALGENTTVPMGWASFTGKCTYQEPGWLQPVGNRQFTVYVEDRNEPGTGTDRFWIEVTGGLSLPRQAVNNAQPLKGGNIVVPHKAR